jgi:hypothetical protein
MHFYSQVRYIYMLLITYNRFFKKKKKKKKKKRKYKNFWNEKNRLENNKRVIESRIHEIVTVKKQQVDFHYTSFIVVRTADIDKALFVGIRILYIILQLLRAISLLYWQAWKGIIILTQRINLIKKSEFMHLFKCSTSKILFYLKWII